MTETPEIPEVSRVRVYREGRVVWQERAADGKTTLKMVAAGTTDAATEAALRLLSNPEPKES